MFVRSAPLNVTPAVERYVTTLRGVSPHTRVLGLELDYGAQRPPVLFVDELRSLRAPFGSTLHRIVALLRWQLFQLAALIRERPQVVQFCDIFSVFPCILSRMLFGTRLVFDIRDVIALSVRHRGRAVAFMLSGVETLGIAASDEVIVVDEPLLSALPKRAASKTRVIPNTPLADIDCHRGFSADTTLRINVAGFVSFRRNLAALLEAQRILPYVRLDVFGTIADVTTSHLLSANGVNGVEKVAHKEALARTAFADVIALMYDPAIGINRFAAPNKYYEGLMLGKPILCADGMGLASEVRTYECGLVVPYGDVPALVAALEAMRDLSVRVKLGANARRLFLERYSGRSEAEMRRLYSALSLLLPGAPRS